MQLFITKLVIMNVTDECFCAAYTKKTIKGHHLLYIGDLLIFVPEHPLRGASSNIMELLSVSFSVGRKGSWSSSSAFDLVTIKWDIWSFRVCSDWTAAKKKERKKEVNAVGNFQREIGYNF